MVENEIKKEVDQTNSRIGELQLELDKQKATFETTQQAFIAGNCDADRLHAEQSKLTLISQAIEALKAQYQIVKTAFDAASDAENRRQTLAACREHAEQAEIMFSDYLKFRDEFNQIIAANAEKLLNKKTEFRHQQKEFERKFRTLHAPEDKASQLQAVKELEQAGLSKAIYSLVTSGYQNLPPVEFAETLHNAESLLASKRYKTEEKERRAAKV